MIGRVAAFCREHGLVHDGDLVLAACSGGPDSLALLDVLARCRERLHIEVAVAYINHGIRAAAFDEERRVQQAAAARGCSCYIRRTAVPALARRRKQSLETAAREERYRLLRDVQRQIRAQSIAVAHHQNDQAETVLWHLVRGSGLTGLAGMRPRREKIIRPFLCVTRAEITDYAARRQLHPCHDETNDELHCTRNKLRLQYLPFLAQLNPAIIADLNRLAAVVQAEDDVLRQQTEEAYRRTAQVRAEGIVLSKTRLAEQPTALQRRLIRRAYEALTGHMTGLSLEQVETVRHLLDKEPGKRFAMRSFYVQRTYEALVCTARPPVSRTAEIAAALPFGTPQVYRLGAWRLQLQVTTKPVKPAPNQWLIDYDRLSPDTVLRCRRPGDRWLGKDHTTALKKIFTAQHLMPAQRATLPLLCQGNLVVWLAGRGACPTLAVQAETKRIGIITLLGGTEYASGH